MKIRQRIGLVAFIFGVAGVILVELHAEPISDLEVLIVLALTIIGSIIFVAD